MPADEAAFAEVLYQADSLDAVRYAKVRETVSRHALAVIRGLFDREDCRAVLSGMRAGFDPGEDRKHDPRDSDAVRRNFQKLQIGENSGVDSRRTLGRFMRALYNPVFAEDRWGLREYFVRIAQFRNLLTGRPRDFAVHCTEQGYWTCARVLQYPRGGGFMVPHRDVYAQTATSDGGYDFAQPLLLLSERGIDFQEGGAYVDRGDARFHYERFCRAGDLVVYDGRSIHGVSDIDPMADLDLQTFGGRAVALVSLYRHLHPGGDDYAALNRRGVQQLGTGHD
jgi:hypothetical protein